MPFPIKFDSIFDGSPKLKEKYQDAILVQGNNDEVASRLDEIAKTDPQKKVFVIKEHEIKNENKNTTKYSLCLGQAGFLAKRYSTNVDISIGGQPTHKSVKDDICDWVLNFEIEIDKNGDKKLTIGNRGVSNQYREAGVMKQTTMNLFREIATTEGDIKVKSQVQHPATWKFYHKKEEYPKCPSAKELDTSAISFEKTISELFIIHNECIDSKKQKMLHVIEKEMRTAKKDNKVAKKLEEFSKQMVLAAQFGQVPALIEAQEFTLKMSKKLQEGYEKVQNPEKNFKEKFKEMLSILKSPQNEQNKIPLKEQYRRDKSKNTELPELDPEEKIAELKQ